MTSVIAGALAVIIVMLPGPADPPGGAAPPGPGAGTPAPWAPGWPGNGLPAPPAAGGAPLAGLGVNLAGWKLTLPVAGGKGGAASVDPTDRSALPWLTRGADGSITLWAPVSGATTPNSAHARTELVSLTTFRAGSGGPHALRASVAVTQLPRQRPDVILGQIHGADGIKSVPFVMLHYDAGTVRVVVKQAQTGSAAQQYPLISGVPLGARFDFTITDAGDGTLRFAASYGATSRAATAPIPGPFRGATVRFQAGDYQQAASSGGAAAPGDGARVTFYTLQESHAPGRATP